ncbi:unnamed protein product [Aspergillus oryzae RIB40]|uniref:non-specific serine/threonine protein kinase n=1 Tax=Aspergillus oryzae (strain ATCC 42149 / RIB 40) TaxID=510516 RepID=Q2UTA6_ASPOR|nr:unnamed protein product [Aspergillus oryzae RIB40]BAE55209.1 unnamed protein product [Aspergillus oryzae RIB40]
MLSSKWTSTPREFPTSGFELLDASSKIEEETLPTYSPEKYYPVQQGEVFNDRYQVLAKLGYGVTSTVWFARDLVAPSNAWNDGTKVEKDIQLKNLLLPTPSSSALADFEEREIKVPAARKILKDRTVYTTSRFPAGDGLPLLGDFGEARFGDEENIGDIMPDYYRAPEVILKSNWDYKVDIWNVAMIVSA